MCIRELRDSGAGKDGLGLAELGGFRKTLGKYLLKMTQVTAPDFSRDKCFRLLPALYYLISGKLCQETIHPSAEPRLAGAICSRFLS